MLLSRYSFERSVFKIMKTKMQYLIGMLAIAFCVIFSFPSYAIGGLAELEIDDSGVCVITLDNQDSTIQNQTYQQDNFSITLGYNKHRGSNIQEQCSVHEMNLTVDAKNLSAENAFEMPTGLYFKWQEKQYGVTYINEQSIRRYCLMYSHFELKNLLEEALRSAQGDKASVLFGPNNGFLAVQGGGVSSGYNNTIPLKVVNNKLCAYICSAQMQNSTNYQIYYVLTDNDYVVEQMPEKTLKKANFGCYTSSDEMRSILTSVNNEIRLNSFCTMKPSGSTTTYRIVDIGAPVSVWKTTDIYTFEKDELSLRISNNFPTEGYTIPKYWFTSNVDKGFVSQLLNQVNLNEIMYLPELPCRSLRVYINMRENNEKYWFNLREFSDIRYNNYISISRDRMDVCAIELITGQSPDGATTSQRLYKLPQSDVSYDENTQMVTFSDDGVVYQQTKLNLSYRGLDAYKVKSWHTNSELMMETKVDLVERLASYNDYSWHLDSSIETIHPTKLYPWFILDGDVTVDGISYHIKNETRNAGNMSGATGTVIASSQDGYTGDIVIPNTITTSWGEVVKIKSVAQDAFQGSNITSIHLSDGIESLQDGTFQNISTLKTVYLDNMNIRMGDAFDKDVDLWAYVTSKAYKNYEADGYGFANNKNGVKRAYCDPIQFHFNGGEFEDDDDELSDGCTKQDGEYVYFLKSRLDLPSPVRQGYKFVGWFGDEECNGNTIRSIKASTIYPLGSDGCIHLYAKWQRVAVDVVVPEETQKPSLEDLEQSNQTEVEEEAQIADAEEKAKQDALTEQQLREQAEEQAKQQEAEQQAATNQMNDSNMSANNEQLEALTSPIAKLKTVKAKKSRKVVVKIKCSDKVAGYEVQASTSQKFKKKHTKTMKVTKKQATFKKLKKGKVYYVRVRGYVLDSDGEKVYGDWSKVKKVRVK